MKKSKKMVFVGLSGGVDSSVAAARLIKEGYQVIGVFIKVWHPDFLPCNWEEERRDAMRVAAHLGIPFLTCDAEKAYYEDVAKYFVDTYAAGRTPNPDVMCNKYVKFGAFIKFAKDNGADYVATGHYAQVKGNTTDGFELHRGLDQNKDQSYFLWTLTQEQLQYTLFPIGMSTKVEIRTEADKLSLPTASKKDSQGICFLGQVDIHDFLQEFITLTPGKVVNKKGQTIGQHRGSYIYTIGQRHGFSVDNADKAVAHYIVSIDHNHNIVIVDTNPPEASTTDSFNLEECNWIAEIPSIAETVFVQTRYRQTPTPVTIDKISQQTTRLSPLQNMSRPVSGQSCVLYDAHRCLGGGIIV